MSSSLFSSYTLPRRHDATRVDPAHNPSTGHREKRLDRHTGKRGWASAASSAEWIVVLGSNLLAFTQSRKPGAPGVVNGEGEGAPGLLTPIVYALDYARITAGQELGNKALSGRVLRNLALEEDAHSRPSGYEPDEMSDFSAPHGRLLTSILLGYVGTRAGWRHVPSR